MMATVRSSLRSVGAVLAGFAVITLGTVLTFTVLVEDFGYYTSDAVDLALGALGAIGSGVAGGAVAGGLAAHHRLRHAAALALPIALDTASIVAATGPGSDPLWFDLGGSATLLLGALVGGILVERRDGARRARFAAPPNTAGRD